MAALCQVALRKESVDRNVDERCKLRRDNRSLSARRAWIEILFYGSDLTYSESLSARRAWIEILYYGDDLTFSDGRSPQGERG